MLDWATGPQAGYYLIHVGANGDHVPVCPPPGPLPRRWWQRLRLILPAGA